MTKFHSEIFDILLCANRLGINRGRGRATKTKKEIVFQPNGNSCKIHLVFAISHINQPFLGNVENIIIGHTLSDFLFGNTQGRFCNYYRLAEIQFLS